MKYVYNLKNDEEVKYIIIEEDKDDTHGFFIYLHASLDEPCLYDGWALTLDEAMESIYEEYGVLKEEWLLTNELFIH
jgi:hypothetical protein